MIVDESSYRARFTSNSSNCASDLVYCIVLLEARVVVKAKVLDCETLGRRRRQTSVSAATHDHCEHIRREVQTRLITIDTTITTTKHSTARALSINTLRRRSINKYRLRLHDLSRRCSAGVSELSAVRDLSATWSELLILVYLEDPRQLETAVRWMREVGKRGVLCLLLGEAIGVEEDKQRSN